jgi:hypothetical protein
VFSAIVNSLPVHEYWWRECVHNINTNVIRKTDSMYFYIGKNIFQIFFSRTTGPKELKFTWKLSDMYIDWSIIYCFTSRSRIFYLYGEVNITSEGLQNLGLCSALRAFEQGGIFTCCDMGPRFFRYHLKDWPIQSPLTTHKGMWRIYSNPDPHQWHSTKDIVQINNGHWKSDGAPIGETVFFMVVLSPLKQEVSYYLKNLEIPTSEPYILLFLVSSSIWWYVGHDYMVWSCPSWYRKCPNILTRGPWATSLTWVTLAHMKILFEF